MLPGPSLDVLRGAMAVGARVSVHRGRTTLVEDLPDWMMNSAVWVLISSVYFELLLGICNLLFYAYEITIPSARFSTQSTFKNWSLLFKRSQSATNLVRCFQIFWELFLSNFSFTDFIKCTSMIS